MSQSLPSAVRLFLAGRWICSAGDWLGATALGWLIVFELKGGSTAFAVNRLLIVVGLLVCASGVGAMLQRISAASVLIVSCGMATVLSLATAVLAWLAPGQPAEIVSAMLWCIVLLGVLAGISHSMRDAGEQRIQMLLVPAEDQHRLEQLWSILYYIGRIAFALISGVCLAMFGASMLFLLDGLSYVLLGVATVCAWKMLQERESEHRTRSLAADHIDQPLFEGFWAAVLHGFRRYFLAFHAAWKNPNMVLLLWLLVTIEGMGFTAWTLLPEIITVEVGGGGFAYGLVIAIGGVGGLAGALAYRAAGASHSATKRMFVAGLFLSPLGLLAVSLSGHAWLLGVCYGVALCGWTWFIPALRVYFRLGADGPLTTATLTFTMYGVCRLVQVLIVIALRWGLELAPSKVLFLSSGASLVCMCITVLFARKRLAACLHSMFPTKE